MPTILDKIFADKKEELDNTKRRVPLSELKGRAGDRSAAQDVRAALETSEPSRIIAEIKRRTPFKGELLADFDAVQIGQSYADNGAAAISILTESTHFGGSLDIFESVRAAVPTPLLRKDFIFDEYQVYESRACGADFFLLIATSLDKNHLADLLALGEEIGIPALVETHHEADMEKAFASGGFLIGINNRDLTSGKTDLDISRRLIPLAKQVPGNVLVVESGIHECAQITEMQDLGAHAFLVGESLMRAQNRGETLKALAGRLKTPVQEA